MTEIDSLYRDILIEYAHRPNPDLSEVADVVRVYNHLCGDSVALAHTITRNCLRVQVSATGCIICRASAVMLEGLVNHSGEDAWRLIAGMKSMLTDGEVPDIFAQTDTGALAGVSQFPARVACAYLAWEALERILHEEG